MAKPNGYFEVFFTGVKKSCYRKSYVFQSGLTQEDILASAWNVDVDLRMEINDVISSKSSDKEKYRLFLNNPLEEGFFLEQICYNAGIMLYNYFI